MKEITSEMINQIIREQICLNDIGKQILNGTNESMSHEQVYAKMVLNSIEISVQLSVKIIMEFLYQSELVDEPDAKLLLKQLSSRLKD